MFLESLFQDSYPWAELKIIRSADEKMNVVGHDDISTNSDVMLRICLRCECHKSSMHRIGRAELTMGEVPSLDWVVEQVEAVTADDVGRVIERVLGGGNRTLALVGPPDTLTT